MIHHLLAVPLALAAPAQDPPSGTWTGTSLCLQGKPVCKDEHVVYHLARTEAGGVRVTMNKIVNGAEEWMTTLDCRWAAPVLTCPMPPGRAPGEWRFRRAGDRMTGGLWLDGRGQFRAVDVRAR